MLLEELRDDIFDRLWAKTITKLNPLFEHLIEHTLQLNQIRLKKMNDLITISSKNNRKKPANLESGNNRGMATINTKESQSKQYDHVYDTFNNTNSVFKSINALENLMKITSFDNMYIDQQQQQQPSRYANYNSEKTNFIRGAFVGKKVGTRMLLSNRKTSVQNGNKINFPSRQQKTTRSHSRTVGFSSGGFKAQGTQRPASFDTHRLKATRRIQNFQLPNVGSNNDSIHLNQPKYSRRAKTAPDNNDNNVDKLTKNSNRPNRTNVTLPRIAF